MNRRMLFVFALFASAGAAAAQTLLNFEAPPQAPAKITTQYGPQGAIFQSAFLRTDPAAHSGTQVLQSGNPSDGEFDPGPFVITFTSPQSHVKFFADSMGSPADHVLKAFDGNGNLVAQDGPRTVAQDVFTTAFEVNVPTPTITRLEFLLIAGGFEVIDDLEFQGEPPGPTPTEPPVVQLIRPINGLELDIPDDIPVMDINGTVTGDGLISPVNVTVANLQPPESTAPPLNLALDLTGTGTTRQFALAGGIAQVPLGPITVTATAENTGNLKGTATSTFNNFPLAIRNRFISEGGAAVLGNFQFGLFAGTCRIAVYEHGAISAANGGAILIHGAIFDKWMSLRSLSNPTSLGCPQNEEHDAPIGFSAREQDFVGGRIYANVPGIAPPGTAYVPAVFREAIEKRGTELVFGLPMGDPTDSIGPASLTWLFQRFLRPGESADLLPSTLEIRNSPPVLLMERQLGPWFLGSFAQSPFDIDRHKSPATLWETFPCDNNLGPCPVPDEPPFPPPNIDNAGDLFCNGITYFPTLEGTTLPNGDVVPPEWVSVRGQYDVTPVSGAITSAHMTDIDNGFTHETHNGNCPYFPNILEAFSTVTCVSDFEFFVRPIGPQFDTSPLPSLFGHDNTDGIKTEYEVSYLALAHNFLGAPAVGDLVHTTGRWIVDCGHATYKTELHPIFSYARMKTVISETNAFTGLEDDLFNGRPATRIGILVNGWFPGGDNNAIEFDAFPPPRPSPDAVLHVVKPVDNAAGGFQAAEDVTMEFQFVPPGTANHIHLKFTSPRRENTVTAAGEMKFDSGRQYWGIWYLYWGN